MIRRSVAVIALTLVALVALPPPASAQVVRDPHRSTATTEPDLPGTTLEAQERDDGNTWVAPWLVGSGIAALAAIGIGGTILKRRAD